MGFIEKLHLLLPFVNDIIPNFISCSGSTSHSRPFMLLLSSLVDFTLYFYRRLSRENAENMHYFSSLALTLNEPEDGVAPTDSRLRPDQRLMEAGLWDEANGHKQRLEESQRLERRKREAQAAIALEEGERGKKRKGKEDRERGSWKWRDY